MRILLRGRNDYRVDVRSQVTVRVSHSLLIVEIGHIPDSTHDMLDAKFLAKIDGEAIIVHDLDPFEILSSLRYYILALAHGVKTTVGLVDTDSDDYLVKDGQSPRQDIQMT